ncbi:MAG: DUF4382 domain-containing protein [Terriglobales bacterium]
MKKWSLAVTAAIMLAALLTACGSSGAPRSEGGTGTVTVTFSDPPSCNMPTAGLYSHIYVTVADVQIHTSSNAGANDAGWIDLTPNLRSAPKQIDLLAPPAPGCFLATLGTAGIPAGAYQQIRLILTDSTAGLTTNACPAGVANCVVLMGSLDPQPLLLSSEAKTGLKIPSGQIAGGRFVIESGESKDLNIDMDGCASVVMMAQGGGQFRLKPVLHAGEVSMTASTAVTGRLVDETGAAIPTLTNAIVALEQKDANGVERLVAQTSPDALGNFSFCPLPAGGSFELVAVATSGNTIYGPTVVEAVKTGTTIGAVRLTKTGGTALPVTLGGTVANNAGVEVDYTLSALQQATIGGAPTWVTVPLAAQQSTVMNVVTNTSGGTCPPNTNCAGYSMALPAANLAVGVIGTSGITYTSATTTPNYKVEAHATSPTTHQDTCTTPVQSTPTVDVAPGGSVTMQTLTFSGCAP